jgi:putative transposase
LYRLLRRNDALAHRRESRKPRASIAPKKIPVTGSNQVWSWDITWLKTEVRGIFTYAYSIIDLFDRSIVGWTIETAESEEHARRLFERIIRDLGVCPQIVHADNGNPMRGDTLAVFLDSLRVVRSYSRPRCSNDNAFIESWHKTLKYTVGYPKAFTSLEHARSWFADFVNWYNTEHLHSGIGYVTPSQKRSGEALHIYAARNRTMAAARLRNPLRWRLSKTMTYEARTVRAFYRPVAESA